MDYLLSEVIKRANRYLAELPNRRVSPAPDAIAGLRRLDTPLQDHPIEPATVLAELDDIGSGATVESAGNRYFGFVTGGALPATLAANILAGVWDQNAVLEQQGWDVESRGLFGAPAIEVIVGEEIHVSNCKCGNRRIKMKIQIIQVPYDCGYKKRRQGLGPGHFINNNLGQLLETDGHQVKTTCIEAESEFTLEIGTAFELNRLLSKEVNSALNNDMFPIVLAGNCNSCLGNIAGINSDQLGIIWFDAHGEFNTPETTLSGFLDGMPLATATGRCWKEVTKTIPGFKPVPESNVILVGARDLDDEEQRQLEQSEVNLIRSEGLNDKDILKAIEGALKKLQFRAIDMYLHIDMDAFDIDEGSANHLDSTGGLKVEVIEEAINLVKKHLKLRASTIASYDPACDTKDKFLEAGLRCAKKLVIDYY
jgi:arginase